jgi:hypothetical protein
LKQTNSRDSSLTLSKAQITTLVKETVGNGVSHLRAIGDEITKMNIKDLEDYKKLDIEGQAHFQKLQFLQHIVNDIIHPLHGISLQLFKEDKALFLDLIRRNESARTTKLLPACFCSSCSSKETKGAAVKDTVGEENVVEQIKESAAA